MMIIEKIGNSIVAFVLDALSKAYNAFLAIFGVLSIVLSPIAAVCFLSNFLIFAVIVTAVGVMVGTIILMSGYGKILNKRVAEIKEEYDKDRENLYSEVKDMREWESARSDVVINSIIASPVSITLHEKIDYNLYKYFKDYIPESKTIMPIAFHRPSKIFFHGLYSCVGTRYFGTDWSKLKVSISNTTTEGGRGKIVIYGNLNNFSAKGNDSREKWVFARIERHIYRRDTDLKENLLPDPEEIRIETISDRDQSLKSRKEKYEEEVKSSLSYIDELEKEVEKLTREYIRTLLKPLATMLCMDIEFEENDYGANSETFSFNEAIKHLNSLFKLQYSYFGLESDKLICELSSSNNNNDGKKLL